MKFKKSLNGFLRGPTLGAGARLLFPTEVVGRELLPDEPYVLAAGPHKTYKETVIVPAFLQEHEFHIMAKDSLFRIPVFGWIFRNAGGIPVIRGGGRGGEAIAPAVAELGKGYPVLIFPESTRFDDFELHRGKDGAVRIALQANVKIVLAGIRGMHKDGLHSERSIHLGLFDPQAESDFILETSTEELSDKDVIRLVTVVMMERLAKLADTTYNNKDERVNKA
jgi:1-acyl-sn-glycerol-3-phosphate acyltransferase